MICQKCRINTATVMITQVVDGERTDFALCRACAEELAVENPFSDLPGEIAKMISQSIKEHERELEELPDITCGGCGMEIKEFSQSGLLGCPRCYDNFEEYLKKLLRRYHGSNTHRQLLKAAENSDEDATKLKRLRRQLNQALKQEDFEKAAEIRDRIKLLESESGE